MSIGRDLASKLSLLGLKTGITQDSRTINVLSVILRTLDKTSQSLAFREIYDALLEDQPDTKLTDAWVHRVIKTLVEVKLLRVESEQAYRKRYYTDLSTITSGLEFIKSQSIEKVREKKEDLDHELEGLNDVDCGIIAEGLVEEVTGLKQKLSSRFIRGLDEFHRVTDFSLYQVAQEGDIIRNCMLWVAPFMTADALDRLSRIFTAASRGVEVRYFITQDILKQDGAIGKAFEASEIQQFLVQFLKLRKEGKNIDFRVYTGPRNTYQFASLNIDRIAFFLTYDPITAVYFTHDFNPELINNSIDTFDKYWENAPSLFDFVLKSQDQTADFLTGVVSGAASEVMDDNEE
ncbi:MAG: hypothetical protein RTU30_04895 [Candidatus Thorarchaeota archaeon]